MSYNILIGCDQSYYDDWGINLLNSIQKNAPWLNLHCHIVNPIDVKKLDFVDYTFEDRSFESDNSRISYLQCVRFLQVAEKFSLDDYVITLDCDTICTQPFNQQEFEKLFDKQYVLQHEKGKWWLAGLVVFRNDNFRYEFAESIKSAPVEKWIYGRDQDILKKFSGKYNFEPVSDNWIKYGKGGENRIFFTLKGSQKTKNRYLNSYKKILNNGDKELVEAHLGGHNNKTHLDHGALEWAINKFNINSFLDIGCGPGGMTELATKKDLSALGIDGDYTIKRFSDAHFLIHDFTKGPAPLKDVYDIGWSVEFVEHVYEEYMPNYVAAMQRCKNLIITYAPPGWPGHHHVNCQPEDYWINKMKSYGLIYNEELTRELRSVSTMNVSKKPKKAFVKNRGLFFVNENI